MSFPEKILVIRNDKLGDFMLAWPAFALLKKQYPSTEITALVPAYTKPMAEICPWIDKIIIDPQRSSFIHNINQLLPAIKKEGFDASISLFSQTRIAFILWLAFIPVRVAPATKIAQLFYNRRLRQKRSLSLKPEYEYNIDLIKYFISINGDNLVELVQPPFLMFDDVELASIKNSFLATHNIPNSKKLIFIHPGCGGSATNLSSSQYAELIQHLSENNLHFIITSGPGELETATEISEKIKNISHSIYNSTTGIVEFSKTLCIADIFISGSTGPLHIVAAANKKTVAFYPAHRSATLLRWQTTNDEEQRLSFSHDIDKDMSSIDLKDIADKISANFL